MGILNVTPDSFSDGGNFFESDLAYQRAEQMRLEGADIIDIGGESSRPGAAAVSEQQELLRVIPTIQRLAANSSAIISIDTVKPAVMLAACQAGATLINDVSALQAPGALEVAKSTNATICLMHRKGCAKTMQDAPYYPAGVIEAVKVFLAKRIEACIKAGISLDNICIDPGFGFGKTDRQNFALIAHLSAFHSFGLPIMVGVSRKSSIGRVLDKDVDGRLVGSLTLAMRAIDNGAHILRVHDVLETKELVMMHQALASS